MDDDDDEEDEEGIVGAKQSANVQKRNGGLNYDSDEDRNDNELITLDGSSNRDRTNTAAENIPKLNRP